MRAKTMEEVLAAERPTYIGGGTDIMPLLKNHVRDDRELVFLKDVEELKGIRAEDGYLYVGAGETLWDISVSETVKGKFMLTMFPFDMIDRFAQRNGWIIHRIERTISASKSSRRRQEEWMVCNYEELAQGSLFM